MDQASGRPSLGEWLGQPWALALSGAGLGLASLLCSALPFAVPQLLCLFAGLGLAGLAVSRQLHASDWSSVDRLESAALVGLIGMTAAVAYFGGRERDWDVVCMVLGVVVLVALVVALWLLLPLAWRKVALLVFIVFHFVGMVTTVTAVDPPGAPGPWLSKQLYLRVYRPYLTFLYMTNAYHFYSPNPGETSQLWFAVHYDNDTWKWVEIPDRKQSPIGMHYQRVLALPEHGYAQQFVAQIPEVVVRRRRNGIQVPRDKDPIPWVEDMPLTDQYRPPQEGHQKRIASLARHLFHNPPAPDPDDDPNAQVRSVKVYRATARLVSPAELAQGIVPNDPANRNRFVTYFLGEFDSQGNLLDPSDPYLYWYLPIIYVPSNWPALAVARPREPIVRVFAPAPATNRRLLDSVKVHASLVLQKDAP